MHIASNKSGTETDRRLELKCICLNSREAKLKQVVLLLQLIFVTRFTDALQL